MIIKPFTPSNELNLVNAFSLPKGSKGDSKVQVSPVRKPRRKGSANKSDGKAVKQVIKRRGSKNSRDRMAAIVEATNDLVGICDPEGNILYLNRAGRDKLGIGELEDISQSIVAEYLPNPSNHLILTEGIPTAIRLGIWSGESVLLSKNGEEFPISQVILAHNSPDGKLEFLSTIMRDISERKRIENHLHQSQKMETVGKLAGGVAHEFNSIMTAIIGHSELMLDQLSPANPLTKNASEIRMAAERAATLTRQLLAYGRKHILKPEILDLNSILAGMESTIRLLAGRNTDNLFAHARAGIRDC